MEFMMRMLMAMEGRRHEGGPTLAFRSLVIFLVVKSLYEEIGRCVLHLI